ncbi:MAG: DNA mismatch repair protein MutS [Verrucomicrobiales bacterium]
MAKKKKSGMTPMMEQYHAIRRSLPEDVLLMYRLGDFYEMFFEDAKEAAPILNVALTKRHEVPMCGVPHHAAEGYIGKLIKANKRVALAEQTTTPVPGKLVEREVTQVISAGTISDLNLLESDRPNYIAAIFKHGREFGLAYADLTTGEFRVSEFAELATLGDELGRVCPSELLVSDEQEETFREFPGVQIYDGYTFLPEQAEFTLRDHFKVQSLDGFGCADLSAAVGAAGAVLHYLTHQMRRNVAHIRRIQPYQSDSHVLIDAASQANLELIQSRAGSKHTLLAALDRTKTPMGARKLRDWLLHPIRNLKILQSRQNLIEAFVTQAFVLCQVQDELKLIRDVERVVGRLSQGIGNPRDMQALVVSLDRLPGLRGHLEALGDQQLLANLTPRLRDFSALTSALNQALSDEPPASTKDGGIFKEGFSAALDELRAASREGKNWIADLQVQEAEKTGIKSLKVKYNAVFGYFIEVTKSNLSQVPDSYIRKQTTTNAERYITPGLKEVEDKILGADERSKQLEYDEFLNLRESVLEHLDDLQDTAGALAEIDVISGLAETARLYAYCKPLLNQSKNLVIKNGRHPVLDQNTLEEKFVPNDTMLEPEQNRLLLITGPNMAGKSTYIRQVALITLMAQIGSWVPADSAEIGLVDRIFTRVGANDDLSRGQSTFMVEMNETSLIVNNATDRSLVILDEIGRGTSTFDGLSIAWSVAEFLHDKIGARALFATHYHELTSLANSRSAVQNYNVAVREWNDEIIFLRKIIAGSADRSYGIQVARLAGLPDEIISRAKEILASLENGATHPAAAPESSKPKRKATRKKSARVGEEPPEPQLSLFS